MIEGFRRMDEKDISYITQLVERADADDVILLYSFTMQKVRNSLLMNLYWETSLFWDIHLQNPVFVPTDMTRSLAGSS